MEYSARSVLSRVSNDHSQGCLRYVSSLALESRFCFVANSFELHIELWGLDFFYLNFVSLFGNCFCRIENCTVSHQTVSVSCLKNFHPIVLYHIKSYPNFIYSSLADSCWPLRSVASTFTNYMSDDSCICSPNVTSVTPPVSLAVMTQLTTDRWHTFE